MDKEQIRLLAMQIVADIKKYLSKTSTSKTLIKQVSIIETEESYNISIPERVYNRKLHVKGLQLKDSNNYIEQVIINSLRTYLINNGLEGTVMG